MVFQERSTQKRRIRQGYPIGCGVSGDEYALSSPPVNYYGEGYFSFN